MFIRYSHSTEPENSDGLRSFLYTRAILPTETTFQSAIGSGGSCLLPIEWTRCGKLAEGVVTNPVMSCVDPNALPRRYVSTKPVPLTRHDFDELVTGENSYFLNKDTEGSVLHFLWHRDDYGASMAALQKSSVYTDRYFGSVIADLKERGLELMMRIKDVGPDIHAPTAEDTWVSLFTEDDVKRADPYANKPIESTFNFKLPYNFSTRSSEYEVKLPNFAVDYSDYAIGAMIERVSDSFDLYATVFFLCHSLLEPKLGPSAQSALAISAEVYDPWKLAFRHFEKTAYSPNGMRKTPPSFYCNISHSEGGPYYIVRGMFIPNKLSPDSNANKRLDIFRCKMKDTEEAYLNLAGTSAELRIEILRGNFSLMRFRIPWKSRKTGFMLSEPPDVVTTKHNAWKGFNRSTPGVWTHDKLYMCVPGWEDMPGKMTLPIFLEWIQYHLLLGVSHIFTAATFGWDSHYMATILNTVGSFIDDGTLTLASHSGDNVNEAYR